MRFLKFLLPLLAVVAAGWPIDTQAQQLIPHTATCDIQNPNTCLTPNAFGSIPIAPYPGASTAITASSGNVAAATATATLAAVAGKTTYICGFTLTSSGSTAAAVVSPTVVGVITGTMTYTYTSVAGVTLSNLPLVEDYTPCIPASAVNTTIVVSVPSLGAGNTNTTVTAQGFQQ